MTDGRIPWVAFDPAAQRVIELAGKVAETATTLLITGESGTGKDQLARYIHEIGPRRDAPYLKIDCASLPQELVESELFGHERGAFTGAVDRKLGRLEMADAGTIVLDEVAALSPATQSKMLRVLEERRFERLGGTETLVINARLIALTNADLPHAISAGTFREDLYFRLSVLTIKIPPLRERPADILALAEHMLVRLAAVHGRPETTLSDPARKALQAYDWPGNVRQLKNAIERALIFAKNPALEPADFPENVRSTEAAIAGTMRSLEEIEREVIRATLEATHYKISRSAEILGISRKTLLDKRKRYGLQWLEAPGPMLIRLLMLGKTRRPEIRALLDDYAARIRRFAELETTELREDSAAALRKIEIAPGATVVLLDDAGKPQSSEQFARWLGTTRDRGAREIAFLCGAADGFPDAIAKRATTKMSLSPLTFSHELARVMLAEQLYRAFATLAGHPYPK